MDPAQFSGLSAWLPLLFDTLPDPVFIKDPDGCHLAVNPAAAQLLGRSPEQICGCRTEDLWPEAIARGLRAAERRALETTAPVTGLEWLPVGAESRPFLMVTGPLLSPDGPVLTYGIARDISSVWRQPDQSRFRELLHASIFERASDGLMVIDPQTLEFVEFNRAAHESLGYTREEFARLRVPDLQAELRPEWIQAQLAEIFEQGQSEFANRHRARDGSIRQVWLSHHLLGREGQRYIATVIRDLTDLEQMQDLLAQAEALAHLGSWELDLRTNRLIWSAETYRIFGFNPSQQAPSYAAFLERVHPEDRAKVEATYQHSLQTREPYQLEHRVILPDGRETVVLERGRTEWDAAGQPLRSMGTVQEITELAIARSHLETLAYRDPLTGLPNRESSLRHLETLLTTGQPLAALWLNLDKFRRINESISRDAGDCLLVQIAELWRQTLAPGDWLARIAGGEFLVIRAGAGEDEAIALTRCLQAVLAAPIVLTSGVPVHVSVSVGISLAPHHGNTGEDLLQQAAAALQAARQLGRNRLQVYDASLTVRVRQQLDLEVRLQEALSAGALHLLYQPQVDPQGTLVGMEALVRWQDPLWGEVPPDEFIPLAENSDLIQALGCWVLDQACAQLQQWRRAGLQVPTLAVNLSPRQLDSGTLPLPRLLQPLLDTYGIEPGQLELEITESCLLPQEGVDLESDLEALRTLGVGLAIDDFGTGYSSLQVLHRLPVQKLKIDRSFLADLDHDAGVQTIVRTTLLMARGLGLKTLAEGVETEAQADLLTAMGCDGFQGYRFSPPLTVGEMTRLLERCRQPSPLAPRPASLRPDPVPDAAIAPALARFLLLPGDGLLLVRADGHVCYLDRDALQCLGSRARQWNGAPLAQVWPALAAQIAAQAAAIAQAPLETVVALGETDLQLRLFRTDDGYGIGLLASDRSASDTDPRLALITRVLGVVQDAVIVTTAEPFGSPGPIILYANEAVLRQTGYRLSDILGRSPRLFQGPDTDPGVREVFRTAMGRWQALRQELLNYRRDGTPFWVEIDLTPLSDAQGWFTHWVAVQRDVTERHQRLQVLAESEEFFRLAMENAVVGKCLTAPDGRFLNVNEAFCRLLGYSAETLYGLRWQDLASEEDLAQEESLARELWEGRRTSYRMEKLHRRPDGSEVWGDLLVSCIRNDDGSVRYFIAQITDISDRKRAEQQQQVSEANLKALIDALPIAVAVNRLQGAVAEEIVFLNEQFRRIFGYSLDDIPTVDVWARKAYPDETYRQQVFQVWDAAVERAIAETGRVESMECRVTCRDGSEREVLIGAVVMEDQLLVSLTDITTHKQTEAELRSIRAELERTAYEVTENIPVGTYTMVLPPDGQMAHFSFMSSRFLELTGLDREAARENPLNAFACVHPEDYEDWVRRNAETFEQQIPFYGETRIIVRGDVRWIAAESNPRSLPDGSTVWEGVLIDITDRKQAEEELQRANRELLQLATTDGLTGVWNRRHFEQMLRDEMQRSQRYGEPLALVLFDVDRFKAINDRFGHLAGDRVLLEVARRVRAQLRSVDGLGRWGGEEFALYLPHTSLEEARCVAEKLRRALAEQPFAGVGTVTASFGVALFTPEESLESWLRRVDQALYGAKHQGRNRVLSQGQRLNLAG